MKIIACDVGGTEIKGALYNGDVIREAKLNTNQNDGAQSVMNTLCDVIDHLLDEDVKAIGIVTAGAIDVNTGYLVANAGTIQNWIGFSLKQEIEEKYNIPCFIDNDANGAIIGEMDDFIKDGVKSSVMITLGTGVGTGLFIDGDIYRGSTYQVEFGHMTLIPNGEKCTCGHLGCAECYLSGSALTRKAIKEVDSSINHGKELFSYYKEGNKKAIKVLDEYTDLLAIYLNSINKVIDPEIFIIGGGVITSKDILLPLLKEKLDKLNFNKEIHPANYGNQAGIKGAHLLALKGLNDDKN